MHDKWTRLTDMHALNHADAGTLISFLFFRICLVKFTSRYFVLYADQGPKYSVLVYSCTRVHFLNTCTHTHRNYGHVLVLVFNVLRFYEYITSTSEYFFHMIL